MAKFTITQEVFDEIQKATVTEAPPHMSPVTEAFAAWLNDQQTNEKAPDRFRFDQEFSQLHFETVLGRKFESIHALYALASMFWGFVGAFDYLKTGLDKQ